MSGIPAWAVRGAKVVAIDTRPSQAGDGFAGLALGLDEVFTLLAVKRIDGIPMCRTRHDESGAEHEPTEWARLSRFRPLTPLAKSVPASGQKVDA